MPKFQITFTPKALADLRSFRTYEQRQLISAIETQLSDQPTQSTRNRKPLRPNTLAQWELRVGRMRIFYDVDLDLITVKIKAIGYKEGSKLYIQGESFDL